jgi:hypothetical protein
MFRGPSADCGAFVAPAPGCSVSCHYLERILLQVFQDAALFIKDHVGEYDVIIVDSSDPVGERFVS